MSMEHPDSLLTRLLLGREEYCQRLLTMLIVGGPYPKWDTRNVPSEAGYRFLASLEELSFGEALCRAPYEFVDELDLGKRPEDLTGSAPDWAVFTSDRLWIIELKTERGSHRDAQVPTYVATGRHYHPDLQVDLTYLTGAMPPYSPDLPDGTRYAHLIWDEVLPLTREVWGDGTPEQQAAVERLHEVVDGFTTRWNDWRTSRIGVTAAPAGVAQTQETVAGPIATATADALELDPVQQALELARHTAVDHKQRAVDYTAGSLEGLRGVGRDVSDALARDEDPAMAHVVPWLWNVRTSTGTAMTSAGAEVGYELRLSWYTNRQR